MYIGANIKKYALKLGFKLWVTKHEDHTVLNIYDVERDRLVVNYDGYGKGYVRGKVKLLPQYRLSELPMTLGNEKHLADLLRKLQGMKRHYVV